MTRRRSTPRAGVTAVVLVSPAVPAHELNVIDSAARAGVAHVVKVTSKASADSPIARRRGQAEIEAGLLASGLGYTLLRNNVYMQNLLILAPAIAATNSFGSSVGTGRVGLVDTRDVAAVAAEVAAAPAAHVGRPTGPPDRSCSPTPMWRRCSRQCSDDRSGSISATSSRTRRRWSRRAFRPRSPS